MLKIKLLLILCLVITSGITHANTLSEDENIAKVNGQVIITPSAKELNISVHYDIPAKDSTLTHIKLFLTPDAFVKFVKGQNVLKYTFDEKAKPFSTLIIEVKRPILKGKRLGFELNYTAKPSKGFWPEYGWIDIDPDFMILPIFTDFTFFHYNMDVLIKDKKYVLYDLNKARFSKAIKIASKYASYYFSSIIASDNRVNKMQLKTVAINGNKVNVFSNKADSISFAAEQAGKILNTFNTTFGKSNSITNVAIVYRPLPNELHKITRSFTPSIIFGLPHSELRTMAHEIGHFWWNRGNDLTTEKWLSESFAEFSKMIFIRENEGVDQFRDFVKNLETRSKGVPPMLGGDRFSSYGDDIIYVKGPYLLAGLEEKIGRKIFQDLLLTLNKRHVNTTAGFLQALQDLTSTDIRNDFEKLLN